MTDLGISKALALAIGWTDVQVLGGYVLVCTGNPGDKVYFRKRGNFVHNHRVFDYRDWNVIAPIAAKYGCFPLKSATGGWWSNNSFNYGEVEQHYADTPQKAIALAVIDAVIRGQK